MKSKISSRMVGRYACGLWVATLVDNCKSKCGGILG